MKKRMIALLLASLTAFSFSAAPAAHAANTRSGKASDVVAVAQAQQDKNTGSTYYKWGKVGYDGWCAAFVAWCADQAGAKSAVPKIGNCTSMYSNIMGKRGGKTVPQKEVQPGDLVFYHNNAAKKDTYCHVALVTHLKGGKIYTAQGNMGGNHQLWLNFKADSYQMVGGSKNYTMVFVRPKYADEKPVADPLEKEELSKIFCLTSAVDGRRLEVASLAKKGNVQVGAATEGKSAQQFRLTKSAANRYSLNPVGNTNLAANPFSDSPKAGTNVNLYTKDIKDLTQLWRFEKVGDQYAVLCAWNDSLALTVDGSNVKLAAYAANNTKQLWILEDASATKEEDHSKEESIQQKFKDGMQQAIQKALEESRLTEDPAQNVAEEQNIWAAVQQTLRQNLDQQEKEALRDEFWNPVRESLKQSLEQWYLEHSSEPNPADPVAPEDPVGPADPVDPIDPVAPVEPVQPQIESGAVYTIKSKSSGKLLDVFGQTNTSSKEANVQVYTASKNNKSQQFAISKTSGGWYTINPLSNTKLAVNPFSDTPYNGVNVNVYTKDTKDKSQGWVLEQVGDYYVIRSAYNESLALTATGTKDKSNVKLATYSGGDNQLWQLTKVQ